jgi:cytochrome c biogenesis protein CcdA
VEATQSAPAARAPTGIRGLLPPALRYGRSFGIGSAFAVGWTPCIGPILGAVLTLAAASSTVAQGAFLLLAWSLGLGVPFLIAGLMLGQVMRGIKKIGPLMPVLEVVGGLLVIVIGALIFIDEFTIFNQYFTGGVDRVTGAEEGLNGVSIEGPLGFGVAFAAGVIAFLSPCTLPMVPAYLAHLAGVSAEAAAGKERGVTFRHSLAFVLGFSLFFVMLGASAGAVGFVVRDNLATIEKIAGALLIALGLNLIGILRIPWLYRTYQIEFGGSSTGGGEAR